MLWWLGEKPGACVIKQFTVVIKFQGNLLITAVIFFQCYEKP